MDLLDGRRAGFGNPAVARGYEPVAAGCPAPEPEFATSREWQEKATLNFTVNLSHTSHMTDETKAFSKPGVFTTIDAHAGLVDELPDDVSSLAEVVQGILVHGLWLDHYALERTPEREAQTGLHGAQAMVIAAGVDAPLSAARSPERRVACICRNFSTLMCGFLLAKRIPARARCGFATYFEAGKFIDHWVSEYWHEAARRWVLVDAQLDGVHRAELSLDFDPLDVPRDRFLVAGEAWRLVRAGTVAPDLFGILDMWGEWYIRNNLMLDFAALRQIELLPWESFGLGVQREVSAADVELLDRVAAATSPAVSIEEVRSFVASEPILRVPDRWVETILAADAKGGAGRNPLAVLDALSR